MKKEKQIKKQIEKITTEKEAIKKLKNELIQVNKDHYLKIFEILKGIFQIRVLHNPSYNWIMLSEEDIIKDIYSPRHIRSISNIKYLSVNTLKRIENKEFSIVQAFKAVEKDITLRNKRKQNKFFLDVTNKRKKSKDFIRINDMVRLNLTGQDIKKVTKKDIDFLKINRLTDRVFNLIQKSFITQRQKRTLLLKFKAMIIKIQKG